MELTCYCFGKFYLVPGRRELYAGDRPITLSPKEFQTLLLLVQSGGEALGREEMIRTIWPDTAVGDTSLGRNISVLRRHLGTETIVSVSRFGYRLVPEVRSVPFQTTKTENDQPVGISPEPLADPSPTSTLPSPFPVDLGSEPHRQRISSRRTVAVSMLAPLVLGVLLIFLAGMAKRRHPDPTRLAASQEAAYWAEVGLVSLREGTYFRASKAFERSLQLNPDSAVVHAYMADTWLQLDFTEAGQREVLLAISAAQKTNSGDHLLLDAISATAIQDDASAARTYEQILSSLDQEHRAGGLEDLCRTLEKAGRIAEAQAGYLEAAHLQPENAGIEVHLGRLADLQRNWNGGEAYFTRAMQLYEAASNVEGEAEVSYQRGIAAYLNAKYSAAEIFLLQSLSIAEQLHDPQMHMRALGALSTVYRWDGQMEYSTRYAQQEMTLAQKTSSVFWYAEGLMHLANLAVALHKEQESRDLLGQALALAVQTHNPRVLANAEFSLAEFSGTVHDYALEISYAQQAMDHYRAYGSLDGIADAFLLRIKGEAQSGDLPRALLDAQTLLASSEQMHSDVFAEDGEEELGAIYSAMHQEPTALNHFKRAQEMSQRTGSQPALKTIHVVGSLIRLGRRKEALALWASLPKGTKKDPDCAEEFTATQRLIKLTGGANT